MSASPVRLTFRNVDASPDDPIETWPVEAIQIAIERGGLGDWRKLVAAVRRDPWGPVARAIEHVLGYARPYGTARLLERALTRERATTRAAEVEEIARRLGRSLDQSGLTRAAFASQLGTSTSRLSTYLSGKVTPAATLLVRAEAVAHRRTTTDIATPNPPGPAGD